MMCCQEGVLRRTWHANSHTVRWSVLWGNKTIVGCRCFARNDDPVVADGHLLQRDLHLYEGAMGQQTKVWLMCELANKPVKHWARYPVPTACSQISGAEAHLVNIPAGIRSCHILRCLDSAHINRCGDGVVLCMQHAITRGE